MNQRQIARTLLVDADDTLWETTIFYVRCTNRFQDYMETLGFDRELVALTIDEAERETVKRHGYGPRGYITALGMAAERLHRERALPMDDDLVARAESFGAPVAALPVVLIAGVERTLRALHPSTRLILVTKGDQSIQRQKIEDSGLTPLLDASYIVDEKCAATYHRIVSELSLDPSETWMVGNSPRSDINPAIQAGLGAIFVPHAHTWGAEKEELNAPELVVTLRTFSELLSFFGVDPSA